MKNNITAQEIITKVEIAKWVIRFEDLKNGTAQVVKILKKYKSDKKRLQELKAKYNFVHLKHLYNLNFIEQ